MHTFIISHTRQQSRAGASGNATQGKRKTLDQGRHTLKSFRKIALQLEAFFAKRDLQLKKSYGSSLPCRFSRKSAPYSISTTLEMTFEKIFACVCVRQRSTKVDVL